MAEIREVVSLPISRALMEEVRTKAENGSIAEHALMMFRTLLKENERAWWGREEFGKNFIEYETGLGNGDLTERKALVGFRVYSADEPALTTELGVMTFGGPRSLLLGELSPQNDRLGQFWIDGFRQFVSDATGEVFRSELIAATQPSSPSRAPVMAFSSRSSIHLFFAEPGIYWFDPNDGMRFVGRWIKAQEQPLVGVRQSSSARTAPETLRESELYDLFRRFLSGSGLPAASP